MSIETTNVFRRNLCAPAHYGVILNRGGARSSKSYSLAQIFINLLTRPYGARNLLVTRKTMPSLRVTAMKQVVDLLKKYGYYKYCKHNKTERTIKMNDNWLLFTSIDDPEKIKSTEFHYIWMEEASEFTYDDFMQVRLRLSGPPNEYKGDIKLLRDSCVIRDDRHYEVNRIFCSFNPDDPYSYLIEQEQEPESLLIHSTYRDNEFCPEHYIKMLEALRDRDPDYYSVYADGNPAELSGIIYQPFAVDMLGQYKKFDDHCYGLDFGYNNPTALVKASLCDKEWYLRELIYQSELKTQDIIDKMKYLIKDKSIPIYADSAEPDRIQEIYDAGFNIKPAVKAVGPGIAYVQKQVIHVVPQCVNILKERKKYFWKKDKNGRYLDDPIKIDDHAMDAIRYALYSWYRDSGGTDVDIEFGDSQIGEY